MIFSLVILHYLFFYDRDQWFNVKSDHMNINNII